MTIQPGAMLYTQGFGSRPENVEVPVFQTRAPLTTDIQYPQGKRWIDTSANNEYSLTSFSTSVGIISATWTLLGAGAGDLNTLTTQDATTVTPSAGNITLSGGGSIASTGSGSTATLALTGLTNHNLLVGAGTSTITNVAPSATSGVPVISQGAAADPTFGTAVVAGGGTGAVTLTGLLIGNGTSAVTGNAVTQHDVLVGGASNAVTSVAPSATTGVALVSQGASADPAFGTVVVAGGGTGAVTLTGVLTGNGTSTVTANAVTQHGVVLGGASNAVASLGVAATGTVLAGVTGADPAFTGSPSVTGTVTAATGIASTTGNIVATAGQVIAGGDTGGVASTIAITNANSTTISSGTGTVSMSTANPGTNAAWIKIYVGVTAYWIPAWTTNAP